jgi:hypothetical protein
LELIPQGQTVNQAYYVEILKRLREAVLRKMSELWSNDWILHHDNAPAYEGVSKSFRTDHLERELQMIQLSATRCSCIAIL